MPSRDELDLPTFKRGRCRRKIIDILAAAGPKGASLSDLAYRIYGDQPECGPDWAEGSVKTTIHEIRSEVERQGWRIVGARPSGVYRLEAL